MNWKGCGRRGRSLYFGRCRLFSEPIKLLIRLFERWVKYRISQATLTKSEMEIRKYVVHFIKQSSQYKNSIITPRLFISYTFLARPIVLRENFPTYVQYVTRMCGPICCLLRKVLREKAKVKFTLEHGMKAQRGSRGIALLVL